MSESNPIDPRVEIGHVHLKVADLERAVAFYSGVLGFEVTQRMGRSAAFLGAGGYHHHIGLNTWESEGGAPPPPGSTGLYHIAIRYPWESEGGAPPPPGSTGLYHIAIRYPDRAALADTLRRLAGAGIELDGAADHGVSEALYLRDPDGNGVELYRDRPREEWPRAPDGALQMFTRPLDLDALLGE
jgi:catechol 2,3-dioxygenase